MKSSFLGKILSHMEHLGPEDLQTYLRRALKERGFLETVFNTLHEGVVVLDAEGGIEYWNHASANLLSFPDDDVLHAPLSRFLKGVSWPDLLRERNAATRTIEVQYPERRVLEFYVLPFEDEEGPPMYVVIFHDVTRQESARSQALESERVQTLTLLAASVAHELGNPLNSLNIHLQLMKRDLRGVPEKAAARLKESIGVAEREIERLDAIISQFLKAIRPTRPDLKPLDTVVLLEGTLELLRHELADRDILVEKDFPAAVPAVAADGDQIKQAFYNIIKNAMQAMSPGGILHIAVAADAEWLTVSFADNGPGIASEDLPHVMEPYYTTKQKGSGLGLMIVHRIVREHGGELEIDSHPGRGTTVRVRLRRGEKRVHLLEG
jgi:signal transduction histidine kinase